MITDRDAVQMRIVLDAIRDLAAGRKRFEDLTLEHNRESDVVSRVRIAIAGILEQRKRREGEIERSAAAPRGHHEPEISGAGVG